MGKKVLRGGEKILGTLASGTGDSVLTINSTTKEITKVPAIDTSTFLSNALPSAQILIGNASNIATARVITGVISISNTGLTDLVANTITNTHINAAANISTSKIQAGTDTYVLTTVAGVPTWAAPTPGGVTSVSGSSNRITSTGGATPAIDISAAYVGQSSITTLGTITTGVWSGTAIGITKGGTGLTALGTSFQQLRVNIGATGLEYFTPSAIVSPPFADNAALVKNNADNTKTITFSAASITTATNRTYTLPNFDGNVVVTAGINTFTGSTQFNGSGGANISIGSFGNYFATIDIAASTALNLRSSINTPISINGGTGAITILPSGSSGSSGDVLTNGGGGGATWAAPTGGGSVPSPAVGDAGKMLRVNVAETAYELFVPTTDPTTTDGDLIQRSGGALTRLAAVATGNALISGGVGAISSWGKIGLTTHVSGTLPVTNGGIGIATVAQGDLLYGSASNVISALAKNASATRYLSNTGATNNPAWTQVDLTNGVTGALPAANGGTGQPTYAIGDLLQASASTTLARLASVVTGNVLISGGVTTVSSWGKVGLTTHVSGILPKANGGLEVALTPTNDDFLQYKTGAWANRTIAQVVTDLAAGLVTTATNQTGLSGNKTWTGTHIFTTAVTTGTGTTAGLQITADALTTGNGLDVSSSSLQSGNLVKLTSTSTALNAGAVLNIIGSGVNANTARTVYGIKSSVTNTNATSGTNYASLFTASGATTKNVAIGISDGIFEQIRTSNFSTTATVQTILNNTSTEIFNLQSNGIAQWNVYDTAAAKYGDIRYSTPGGLLGIVINNATATARYQLAYDATNNYLAINNNVVTSTFVTIGMGAVTPSATFQVRGRATTTGALFRLEDSSGTARMTMTDAGATVFQGTDFTFGGTTITSGSVLADFQSTTEAILLTRAASASIATKVLGMIWHDSGNDFLVHQGAGLVLGYDNAGSTRAITAQGSATDITLSLSAKGAGVVQLGNDLVLQSGANFTIRVANLTSARDLTIKPGDYPSGTGNGGNLYLTYGAKSGVASDGNIGLLTSSGSFGAGERVIFEANAVTVPSTNPSGGAIRYVDNGVEKYRDTAGNVITI